MGTDMGLNVTKTKNGTIRAIFFPIFLGMLTAQVIATWFVYLSNQNIHSTAEVIQKNGFFPIPTGQAMVSLNSFGAAFGGGLFFTLSIGVGLTLVTWGAFRIWQLFFKQDMRILAGYGAIWTGLFVWINLNGLVFFPSLFCLTVPLITGWITIRGVQQNERPTPVLWLVPVVTLALLTGLWATQFNAHLFTSIRDHILLSNPIGRSVNDFYYRYTLYAAESFKSFNQKTLRTCKLEGFEDEGRRQQLEKLLLKRDVLAISDIDKPDVKLISANGKIHFAAPRGKPIETTFKGILGNTNGLLSDFSQSTDRYRSFRRTTLYGLLAGFPILLFVICYGLIRTGLGLMMRERLAVITASALCLFIGILLFLPMLRANPVEITRDGMNKALASDQWTHRVAALRFSDINNIEIARYPSYQNMVTSPLVVERYWLARALARSRVPSTYGHLLTLLEDPHPNVICQALFALGERRQRQAIDPIKKKLADLDHWYAQWYGYRALRRLGWHQGLSK